MQSALHRSAYIECHAKFMFLLFADVPDRLSLRLVDGSSDNEGRVEILFGDSWGTVCDDNWDLSDAEVVCKQLGYDHAIQAIVTLSQYPPYNEGLL